MGLFYYIAANQKIMNHTFQGAPIYRFKVISEAGAVIYQCASTSRTIPEVVDEIYKMFSTKVYRVMCNGELVAKNGYKKFVENRKIKDKETGTIFESLYDFMDTMEYSKYIALQKIKKLNRYEWIV